MKMRYTQLAFVLLGTLAFSAICAAEEAAKVKVEFKVKTPEGTAADAKLYLAGNVKEFGGEWKADGLELKKGEDGKYTVSIEVPKGTALEFKVTRGDWDTVEKQADGKEIDNRKHAADKDETVEVEVKKWAK